MSSVTGTTREVDLLAQSRNAKFHIEEDTTFDGRTNDEKLSSLSAERSDKASDILIFRRALHQKRFSKSPSAEELDAMKQEAITIALRD